MYIVYLTYCSLVRVYYIKLVFFVYKNLVSKLFNQKKLLKKN